MKDLRTTFKSVLFLIATSVTLAVSGCDGGGSSSSGAGGFTAAQLAGTYQGGWQITIAAGGNSFSGTGSMTIVIQPDGTVIRDPAVDGSRGQLTGNAITIANPGSFVNSPGVSCSGSIQQNGTVQGTEITGTFSSTNLMCNGMSFTITGSFQVSIAASAALPGGGGNFREFLQDAVR